MLIAAVLALAACGRSEPPAPAAPPAAEADAFVAQVNAELKRIKPLVNISEWVQATYITDDTERLAAKFREEYLALQAGWVAEAQKYRNAPGLSPETARALTLLANGRKLVEDVGVPSPRDPAARAQLAQIGFGMKSNYGAATWCRPDAAGNEECLTLPAIERIVNNAGQTHTPDEIAQAWAGWHKTARPIRNDYAKFVDLANAGARDLGFADAGELWRANYDMTPAAFEAETGRLWGQVKPLYEELHCHVRARLNRRYGDALVPERGLIPAHLLGNMWAQQWSNLYPLVEPFARAGSLDVTSVLETQREAEYRKRVATFKGKPAPADLTELGHRADRAQAERMTRIAEDFYTSLGFPALPESFWRKSLFVQPRDRAVVCHASAWDIAPPGDVRIKQCIEPDEDQLVTLHHELGHVYYYLLYAALPPLFQESAMDGFHEAIGDAIALSLTPGHLDTIGLVPPQQPDPRGTINAQMKLALDRVAFLPFGKLIDQWRWKVFSGEVTPAQYNAAWWNLRAQYQGVSPPLPRSEEDFDPGAKYHVPANVTYTRYFLAHLLQFQFYKALCEAAGHEGPLHQCDVYGNKEAGAKYMEMLRLGASKPWPDALEALTGSREVDAAALLEYFAPLAAYLKEQNRGQACGWETPPP